MARAQTTLDFLVGTTVFLLTVSAVLVTVPGLSDPFVSGAESDTITADRSVERLATDILVQSSDAPYVFQTDSVSSFFGQTPSEAKTQLGIDSTTNLNVTLDNSTTRLHALGPSYEERDVSVAWRTGRYQDDHVELVVRVW